MLDKNGIKWSREETILALDLYLKITFSKATKTNKEVIKLANILGRTPSSVAMKVCNIASCDPLILNRHRSGLKNASKLDREIFEEFSCDLEELAYEANTILKNDYKQLVSLPIDLKDMPDGLCKESTVKVRLGQNYFRNAILKIYGNKCCVTGIDLSSLLVASHIKPWAVSDVHNERTNPSNGLCLNAFHDKAFDHGLITFDKNLKMVISSKLEKADMDDDTRRWIKSYSGQKIHLPECFAPSAVFMQYHNDVVFLG